MGIPIWLSIDYDYFVRYLPQFDWSHQESAFFQGGMMWMIRVASQHSVGGDLREAMSPKKHATPKPQTFFNVLKQLGYDFSNTEHVVVADSHAMAGPIFNQLGREESVPELLVSFDAHHDLGYHGWSRTQEFIEQDQCSCDMWLCAVLCWYEKLKARIIYPPWQTTDDLELERKQIRENIPAPMLKRVKADLFLRNDAVSSLSKPPRGKTFDVQAIFICRSSAWVPPWLDEDFNEFVKTVEDELGLSWFTPGISEGIAQDPMEPRTDFDYDAAVQQGELIRQMMELGPDGFKKMVDELSDEADEEDEEEPVTENPEDRSFDVDRKRARELMAVRRIDWGDIGNSFDALEAYLAELLGITIEEAHELWHSSENLNRLVYSLSDEKDVLMEHELLPPVPDGYVRFIHSVLHGDTSKERWGIIEGILKHGLQPQAEGAGKYSEAPWLVFGIARVPGDDTSYRYLIYNKQMPWVTADIPIQAMPEIAELGFGRGRETSGQMSFYRVPREYIVAVNGLPVDDFIRAMKEFSYPGAELKRRNPQYDEKNPLLV